MGGDRARGAARRRAAVVGGAAGSTATRAYASGVITVGPQARELGRSIVAPGMGRLLPPAGWLNRLVTIGLLPPHIRDQYGFPWSERRQRMLDRIVPAVRVLRGTLPDSARALAGRPALTLVLYFYVPAFERVHRKRKWRNWQTR